jgi:hypothetical protein
VAVSLIAVAVPGPTGFLEQWGCIVDGMGTDAILVDDEQAGLNKLSQMRGSCRCGDARLVRAFPGGERAARHQRGENIGARRVSNQRAEPGDVRSVFHGCTLARHSR